MSLATPSPPSIYGISGNESYIHFEFSFSSLPMVLLFVPLLYIPITIIIILRILVKLIRAVEDKNVNVHVFTAISISHFMCLLFFLCDLIFIRLPSTGLFTSWCARNGPFRAMIAIHIVTYHVNYSTMMLPAMISLMRLILIYFPHSHKKINGLVLRVSVPFVLLYPLPFTFFMYPAVAYCYQPGWPYSFGQVLLSMKESLFGLRNNYFLLGNSIFWTLASVVNNAILIMELVKLKTSLSTHMRSQQSHRAEVSLTVTTLSMVFSHFTNVFTVTSYFIDPTSSLGSMLRPFGNDLETCVVPWVFYLTHPVFRGKKRNSIALH